MHKAVELYIQQIRNKHSHLFRAKRVLDVGSLDINGSNRRWFKHCSYLGVDLVEGKNVDVLGKIHEVELEGGFDFIISTEMLEHDVYYSKSLLRMYNLLKSGGVLLFTAASIGRTEHGTVDNNPQDSPLTNDYYKNITVEDIATSIPLSYFSTFEIRYTNTDIYFFGIKR